MGTHIQGDEGFKSGYIGGDGTVFSILAPHGFQKALVGGEFCINYVGWKRAVIAGAKVVEVIDGNNSRKYRCSILEGHRDMTINGERWKIPARTLKRVEDGG